METDASLLAELREIGAHLETIKVMVGVIAATLVIWFAGRLLVVLRTSRSERFRDVASDLLRSREYEGLRSHCAKRLEKNPDSIDALWYLAVAHFQGRQYEQAKELFLRVATLEPSWRRDAIEPYMKEIERLGDDG